LLLEARGAAVVQFAEPVASANGMRTCHPRVAWSRAEPVDLRIGR